MTPDEFAAECRRLGTGAHYENERVEINGRWFGHCVFLRCTLVFADNGESAELQSCVLENCVYDGAAWLPLFERGWAWDKNGPIRSRSNVVI